MGTIRVVLALAVLVAHADYKLRFIDPGLAVQAFYVISGFYMSLILTEARYQSPQAFYLSRALRLFPSYYVVLLLSLAFVAGPALTTAPDLPAAISIAAANFFIFGQDVLFWFGLTDGGALHFAPDYQAPQPAWKLLLVPQAWSISLELMFYAIAPFLAAKKTRALLIVVISSIAVRYAGDYLDVSYHLWPRRFFPAELCLFVSGMIAHRIMDRLPAPPRWVGWVMLLALVLLIATHRSLRLDPTIGRTLLYAAVCVSLPILFTTFRHSSIDQLIGELSYPVYLVHFLAIAVVEQLGIEWRLPAALCLTAVSSVTIYYAIDRPIGRYRRRLGRAATAT